MKYNKDSRLKKLGVQVKSIRKVRFKSLLQFAHALGVDRRQIARVEAGAHEAGVLLFVDIAKLCHVTLDELMGNLDD